MKGQPIIAIGVFMAVACCGCSHSKDRGQDVDWGPQRLLMLETLKRHGVHDKRILAAMEAVRRDRYIPADFRHGNAYGDHPAPIGHGQTISQPFVVAYMTWKMNLTPGERVLEIGTGSGYQAAILAELGMDVYSIEIVPALAEHARSVLAAEGYASVNVLTGDGYKGWPEHAPFDAIIVTCAPEEIPPVLVDQLRDGGRMILPVGRAHQRLIILRKQGTRVIQEDDLPVRFVPMVKADR